MLTPQQAFEELVADGDVLLDVFDRHVAATPGKTCVIYGETGLALTFAEVQQRTNALALGLSQAGIGAGDHVSILTRNAFTSFLTVLAVWRLGAVYAPVNFNLRGPLLVYQLRDTAPKLLITDPSFDVTLGEILADMPPCALVVAPERFGAADAQVEIAAQYRSRTVVLFTDLLASAGAPPLAPLGPFDTASIVYTSGTTGPSKGVVLPHRWINQYTFVRRKLMNENDVVYCDLPLYHVGGVYALVGRALYRGATIALYDRFSPTQFWTRIADTQSTVAILLDVMVPWLMSAEPSSRDRENPLTQVHMQPLPPTHHAVAQRFGIDWVTAGFGQTESGMGFSSAIDQFWGNEVKTGPRRGMSKDAVRNQFERIGIPIFDGAQALPKGFMGVPSLFLDVALLDEDDAPVAEGAIGQLAFRPRFPGLLLKEYLRKPEATLKACRNLWFHTGDACRAIGDGRYVFVDRMGGYFRVRGENVSSFEVESLMASHPKVRAVAAVPIPARVGSEDEIAAFVEPMTGETVTEAELRDHAVRQMPKYMVPSFIRIIDALPVTPTSKVEKYKLKQSLLAELSIAEAEKASA